MKYKIKKCKQCGNEFPPTGVKQKYCSIECNVKDNITIDSNGCWNWKGYKDQNGYGQVAHNKKSVLTHRVMCESVHGITPVDKPFALHACDNPACCNPDHLRWGSPQDNMDDKKERNRSRYASQKGEQNGRSKLIEEQVIEIIDKLKNFKHGDYIKLATEYDVSPDIISGLHKNKKWKHIPR